MASETDKNLQSSLEKVPSVGVASHPKQQLPSTLLKVVIAAFSEAAMASLVRCLLQVAQGRR